MEVNEIYMRRAISLALKGKFNVLPNPMVGAVIVGPDGKILGEGYHRKCGEAHAEVNAIDAVKDKALLRDCTMYVTLEPCSHYGHTPPCADLIIRMGIPRVVVGCLDTSAKVNGKGVQRLLDAGVEVEVGCLEEDCRSLNIVFFTAHEEHRPYIMLKWAQSADGFIGALCQPGERVSISTPLTTVLVHRIRSYSEAIMVGSGTVILDNPWLTVRKWPGRSPMRVVVDRRNRLSGNCNIFSDDAKTLIINDDKPLRETVGELYAKHGVTFLLVEGGTHLLQSFIDQGLWDLCRVEYGTIVLGEYGTARAPRFEGYPPLRTFDFEGETVKYYSHNPRFDVKNL
ncbi:MAG: bifunctional diaminohydroxyphosphoribosylaminopyrimidine deaminase/5-amino-6-(5-phosphoribosylamino)uracil reductase RibD [Muribaculaceae bacterium]|nr:bifunctional diaminohydroxyphosphoribosylaminopyrimidine deaminase/5-amino-6-(5-phosphoribosylamino)uracil reductase RibD [Muribaculaceae bacterium]